MKLLIEELKATAEMRGIKGYKSMSKGALLRSLTLSKSVKTGKKPKISFSKAKHRKDQKRIQ